MSDKSTTPIDTPDDHAATGADTQKEAWVSPKLNRLSTTVGTKSKDSFNVAELADTVGPS